MHKRAVAGFFLFLIFLRMSFSPIEAFGQSVIKTGGVSFGMEQNPPLSKVHSYDSLFNAFGYKYNFAVTSYVLPLVTAYADTIRALSNSGVEILDNTPTHATQFFNVLSFDDTAQFSGRAGVDHINGQKICLKISSFDTTPSYNEGRVNVFGNKVISFDPGEFSDLAYDNSFFAIYLGGSIDSICLYYNVQAVNPSDPDTLFVKSLWDETVSYTDTWYIRYHKMQHLQVTMHDSAVSLLNSRSLDIFDQMNINRPNFWYHPTGPYPSIPSNTLKAITGNLYGYLGASTTGNPSYYCYNEYNPFATKQFGVPLSYHYSSSFDFKYFAANAIARHFILTDFSTIPGNWYIQELRDILSWCQSKNIAVKTLSEWNSLLYDSTANKTVNIFPKLNVDLDGDHWPDGYVPSGYVGPGIYDTLDGVSSSGYRSFKMIGGGTIFCVAWLAGLEKNTNRFSFYLKGNDTTSAANVSVDVYFPENGQVQTIQTGILHKDYYQAGPFIINIPDSISVATFLFRLDTNYHDTMHISGIDFRSTGFLSKSKYPEQLQTANNLFPDINLGSLILDSTINFYNYTWTFRGAHNMNFEVIPNTWYQMRCHRPNSFWVGKDSVWAIAQSVEGFRDSCLFRFTSDTIPGGCGGETIGIAILDTLTSADYVVWTSEPWDSTISDSTVFNPTVSPVTTTKYRVKVYNLLGNIYKDSVTIYRYDKPVPGLFHDSTICQGTTIELVASGGVKYRWSTGDKTAAITVKPDTTTLYKVVVTNEWGCTGSDSSLIHVKKIPVVTIHNLQNQYCNNVNCVTLWATPPGGSYGGTSGIDSNLFCPRLANPGLNRVWYTVITSDGCLASDTLPVSVDPPPVIPNQPDTNLCSNKKIFLKAGSGADYYLWFNGRQDSVILVDSTGHGLGLLNAWVIVTKNACMSKDTARINFVICPTGLSDPESSGNFSVYPNPFSDRITVTAVKSEECGKIACIADLRGTVLLTSAVNENNYSFDTRELPSGVYILILEYQGRKQYIKVVRL